MEEDGRGRRIERGARVRTFGEERVVRGKEVSDTSHDQNFRWWWEGKGK